MVRLWRVNDLLVKIRNLKSEIRNTICPPVSTFMSPFAGANALIALFYSIPSSSLIPKWLNSLKKEVLLYKGQFDPFDSLYVGGGTPTFLETRMLADLIGHLFAHFDFAPDTEVTIEANPCDLTVEKIRMLRDAGVNRVNLGGTIL